MPLLAENPNLAIVPDFESNEHAEARAQLINDTVDEQQAADILASLWRIQNNSDKLRWDARLQEEARTAEAERRQAAEAEAQRQQTLLAEQEAAVLEERKKNKSKYAPIRNIDIPSNPIILPCQYAIRRMKSGEFCELFYFTNNGLEEASRAVFTADEDALIMLPTSDGMHKWIPAGAARDPKAQVVKDENLTWEQFNEAAPCMIALMKENDWPDDRVDMHIAFWSALQNHRWRHDFEVHKQ
ncbi:hypothetical protein DEU56DRAFT_843866 [Suillus clintonianus]|uniref:uncharacterized protein n=1 Tax=Suillus clintonianus TaxID=1904413 RepID=UPI001B85F982|nr:uncharacterized protein DEU56DRAFT_843866 [Suillus clintonianus]KAG2111122.1 hypothetical protein DEU56DRAFT_843866 [Suillus clintonianus]